MFSNRSKIVQFLLVTVTIPFLVPPRLLGQEIPRGDTLGFDHTRLTHHAEVGINALGGGLVYRYQWFSFFSTDAIVSVSRPGAALGLTFSPGWIFFVQGVVGTGEYKEAIALDGPPAFKPSYLYGWDAGFHIPIAPKKTRLYFIFAFGQLRYVQHHYNYNGGGFIVGPPPAPLYRTETRAVEVFSIGLGMSF